VIYFVGGYSIYTVYAMETKSHPVLQAKLPLKISWKKLVRKEVEKFWLKRLQNDATAKTTLKYLAIKHLEIGTSYPLLKMKSKTTRFHLLNCL
jgi:aminoglycoside phosphotransferase family enzyme